MFPQCHDFCADDLDESAAVLLLIRGGLALVLVKSRLRIPVPAMPTASRAGAADTWLLLFFSAVVVSRFAVLVVMVASVMLVVVSTSMAFVMAAVVLAMVIVVISEAPLFSVVFAVLVVFATIGLVVILLRAAVPGVMTESRLGLGEVLRGPRRGR